jgi:hypothetical protein
MNKVQIVQECDATIFHRITEAGNPNKTYSPLHIC